MLPILFTIRDRPNYNSLTKIGASRGDDGSAAGGREDLENIAITALEGKIHIIRNDLQCSFSDNNFCHD